MRHFKHLIKRSFWQKTVLGATLAMLMLPGMVMAQVALPAVNLGVTSFQDGYAGPGTLVDFTLDSFSADKILDNNGNTALNDVDIDANAGLLLLAHFTEKKLFGAWYGFEVLIPVVDLDIDVFGRNTTSGLGDIAFSPLLLQWTDHKLFGLPIAHRFNLAFAIPTGKYDSQDPLNVGNNAFRFNPHYAFTIELTKNLEASFRAHYLWNGENDSYRLGDEEVTSQAGEAFHLNFATSYQVSDKVRLGAAGYFLKQISSHEIESQSIANVKEQVLGFGPGIQAQVAGLKVVFNAYFETEVKSRAKGRRLALKIAKVF